MDFYSIFPGVEVPKYCYLRKYIGSISDGEKNQCIKAINGLPAWMALNWVGKQQHEAFRDNLSYSRLHKMHVKRVISSLLSMIDWLLKFLKSHSSTCNCDFTAPLAKPELSLPFEFRLDSFYLLWSLECGDRDVLLTPSPSLQKSCLFSFLLDSVTCCWTQAQLRILVQLAHTKPTDAFFHMSNTGCVGWP